MDRIQRRVCLHQLGRSPAILPVILTIAWGLLLASPESARGDQVSGSWGAVQTLPYAPINANMLPTGKVLFYEKDNALIWDPDTGSLTTTPKADTTSSVMVIRLSRTESCSSRGDTSTHLKGWLMQATTIHLAIAGPTSPL